MTEKLERLVTAYRVAVRDELSAKHKRDATDAMLRTANSAYAEAQKTSSQAHAALMTFLHEGIDERI